MSLTRNHNLDSLKINSCFKASFPLTLVIRPFQDPESTEQLRLEMWNADVNISEIEQRDQKELKMKNNIEKKSKR